QKQDHQPGKSGESGGLDPWRRFPAVVDARLPWCPHERQCCTGEQATCTRVRAVVQARGIATGAIQDSHEECRTDCGDGDCYGSAALRKHAHEDQEDRWPEDVELLLDSERPEVLQE